MNLREWALSQGIHPQTAYKWYRAGKLPIPARKVGQLILVGDLEPQTSVSKSAVFTWDTSRKAGRTFSEYPISQEQATYRHDTTYMPSEDVYLGTMPTHASSL